jgi:dipeptidase
LRKVRDPLEGSFFKNQPSIEARALELYKKNPKKAKKLLTGYTKSCMEKTVKMYKDLRNFLITKYTNNKLGL